MKKGESGKNSKNRLQFFIFLGTIFTLLILAYSAPSLKAIQKITKSDRVAIEESPSKTIAELENQSSDKIIPLVIKKEATIKNDQLRLIFVGDIMLARGVGKRIRENNQADYPFIYVKDFLKGADLTFANLESPISDKGEDLGHLYSFRADPKTKIGLKESGIDIVSLANNHANDWGSAALLDTIDQLKSVDISAVGAGENISQAYQPVIFEIKGQKIAYLAFTDIEPKSAAATVKKPGVAWLDLDKAKEQIDKIRQDVDLVIVSLHTGIEYQPKHSKQQEVIADQLLKSGVDLIIGHHPHVIQDYRIENNKFVFYSLGNFIFDQNWSEGTRIGQALEIVSLEQQIIKVTAINLKIDPKTFQPVLDKGSQKNLISN